MPSLQSVTSLNSPQNTKLFVLSHWDTSEGGKAVFWMAKIQERLNWTFFSKLTIVNETYLWTDQNQFEKISFHMQFK